MPSLTKANLQYDYSWTPVPPDDPKVTGVPDSTLLNGNEGYEVLAFLNRISAASADQLATAQKAERMIKTVLPSNFRSHAHVLQWLIDNWSKYQ